MIISVLIVVAVLSLLVFIHELGHFIAARRSGVTVEEFGFGLPPRLVGIKRKGTILSLNWLPLGGFVRLKGENSAERGAGSFGAARYSNKAKILLAGVFMNALVGYILLLYLTLTGLPPIPGMSVDKEGATYVQPPRVMILSVSPGSVAEKAGLKKGDVILSGNRQDFEDPEQLKDFTKQRAGQAVVFEIARGKDVQAKTVMLSKGEKEGGGQLGVLPFQSYQLKYSPGSAAVVSARIFGQVAAATVSGFGKFIVGLPQLVGSAFKTEVPDTGAVGPVGITAIISNILFLGFRYILLIVVSITISLAVINAFPIPALDGGRLLMITLAKVLRRDLSKKIENAFNSVGFMALIALIIFITFLDIRRFF